MSCVEMTDRLFVYLARRTCGSSIRLMFSIADINSGDRDADYEDGVSSEQGNETSEEDSELPSYPIRASFSITKVTYPKTVPAILLNAFSPTFWL
jgi:Mitochondrial glycoprotein